MSYTKRLSLICAICLGTFMATLDITLFIMLFPCKEKQGALSQQIAD